MNYIAAMKQALEYFLEEMDEDVYYSPRVIFEAGWNAAIEAAEKVEPVAKVGCHNFDDGGVCLICGADIEDAYTAPQPAIPDGWQPIETAPKDGTWILLAGGEIEYGWEGETVPPIVVGQTFTNGKYWHFAWYDSGFYGGYEKPTHWMPLPAAPKMEG